MVAILNAFVNALRPDDAIAWPLRVPRILYELSLATVSKSVGLSSIPSRPSLLLLAVMLLSAAVADIFVWSPLFAAFVQFETCTSGGNWFAGGEPRQCRPDLAKGYGRLFVVLQSVFGGIVYLHAGISAWTAYAEAVHQDKVKRHVQIVELYRRQREDQWQKQQFELRQPQRGDNSHGGSSQAFPYPLTDSLWKLFFNTD